MGNRTEINSMICPTSLQVYANVVTVSIKKKKTGKGCWLKIPFRQFRKKKKKLLRQRQKM